MQINIDWLSFTVKRQPQDDDEELQVLYQVIGILETRYPAFFSAVGDGEAWKWSAGRKPYRASWRRADDGVAIFLHPALDHALIEITGRGCETLGEWHDATGFLSEFSDRLTRLDLACDMLTDATPAEFVEQRQPGRFKSDGHVTEQSGSTEYVGSRKSSRFACVYRYNPPHERSHLLRCEYRLHDENAKITAASILENGQEAVAEALGRAFGWLHPVWSVEAPTLIELQAYRPDRKKGSTLFWLNDTVAKTLVRLHRDGTLDAQEWFATNVLHMIEKSGTL